MTKDLICFSHLRWNFVYQRPQHLLSRFSKTSRVFFIEEPLFDATDNNYFTISKVESINVHVINFHLTKKEQVNAVEKQKQLLDGLIEDENICDYISWYYSPLAFEFSKHLQPSLIIYDCMDELSAFRFAPPELKQIEKLLLQAADIVFTGGYSLYEAKKDKHPFVYAFPSSIDKDHFYSARNIMKEPADQQAIPHPRLGFYGVIDERFNIELFREITGLKPEWHFVIAGPVVKIDEDKLPRAGNIHYLGSKDYTVLPQYLAGWDIAIMPFALNESTRYISPTKTPEFLAGGKPVVSTSIRDVVKPYGINGYVFIADTTEDFIKACEKALLQKNDKQWLQKADKFLAGISWDKTWSEMVEIIEQSLNKKYLIKTEKITQYV